MHIGIDIGLQQLKSERFDGLLPEEKDWILNEAQYKFIDNQTNPISNPLKRGLESSQTRYDNISELITPYRNTLFIRDNRSVYAPLPFDYFNLVNDRSFVVNNCNKVFTDYSLQNVNYCQLAWELFSQKTITAVIHFLDTITINGTLVYNASNYSTEFRDKPKDERDIILKDFIPYLINLANITGVRAYWESYINTYTKGSVIIADTNSSLCTANSVVVTYKSIAGAVVTENYTGAIKTVQKFNIPAADLLLLEEVPNRLTKTEDLYTKLESPFHTTKLRSPISGQEVNGLIVFHNKKFILNEISIDYIRKPRTINLLLGQNCELHDINNNHQKIVNIAVDLLAARILAPNYQVLKQENIK